MSPTKGYLDHSSSIVTDKGLNILGFGHFLMCCGEKASQLFNLFKRIAQCNILFESDRRSMIQAKIKSNYFSSWNKDHFLTMWNTNTSYKAATISYYWSSYTKSCHYIMHRIEFEHEPIIFFPTNIISNNADTTSNHRSSDIKSNWFPDYDKCKKTSQLIQRSD